MDDFVPALHDLLAVAHGFVRGVHEQVGRGLEVCLDEREQLLFVRVFDEVPFDVRVLCVRKERR